MKSTIYIFLMLLLSVHSTKSQEVISTSGDYFEFSGGSVSWTICEVMTETFTDGTTILTQGFQQSKLSVSTVEELQDLSFSIQLYPNPTKEIVHLTIEDFTNTSFQLFDFQGKLLHEANIMSKETELRMSDYSNAAYFLKLIKDNTIIGTYRILKY